MRIGIPVWHGRISPVFDAALRLLIVEISDEGVVSRHEVSLPDRSPGSKAEFVGHSGLDLLICGAVSRRMQHQIEGKGIRVLPWMRGCVDAVIEAYRTGRLTEAAFRLPGCGRGCQQRRRCRGNRNSGRSS